MLIRLLEINCFNDKDPYEDAKFLAGFTEDHYGEFIRMIREMKDNGEEFQVAVENDWYTIDSYVFCFPKNSEFLPCINVYVL